jgi:hypothetical protein
MSRGFSQVNYYFNLLFLLHDRVAIIAEIIDNLDR